MKLQKFRQPLFFIRSAAPRLTVLCAQQIAQGTKHVPRRTLMLPVSIIAKIDVQRCRSEPKAAHGSTVRPQGTFSINA